MRIVQVIEDVDPVGGGPPLVAIRLAAAQASQGHQVTLIARARPGQTEREIRALHAPVPGIDLVRFELVPPGHWPGHLHARAVRKTLRAAIADAEVVHLHGVWGPILPVAAHHARAAGVPYVITPHGMLRRWSLKQHWLKKRIALAVVYRRMLRGAAAIQALSNRSALDIAAQRLGAPVEIIPNGVCVHETNQAPPVGRFYEQHPELAGRPFLLYLGRLHAHKGIDLLIDALALLANEQPELQLVIQGPDAGAGRGLRLRAAQRGMDGRVKFLAPVYGPERLAPLRDAARFCLTSRGEGFSLGVLEALALGTPALISEPCCFPEVQSAGAGLVVDLEAGAVAGGIRELIRPERRAALGQAGRKLVREGYTWPHVAGRMVQLYQRVAGQGSQIAAPQEKVG